MARANLKGMTAGELSTFAQKMGEKGFRGKQLFTWLYTRQASSFNEMTSLAKSFRERLESVAAIESLDLIRTQESPQDGTTKYLFQLADARRIESVLIPPATAFQGPEAGSEEEQKRLTLCVSTQVGCPLDCAFCATGRMGFLRNLSPGEILDQLLAVKRLTGRRVTNLVYMGMGEPLMNYDNVMKSIEIITTGMGIAARRITVSTAGWVPGIRRMAEENRKAKLAVSLHSLEEEVRGALMPVTKKFTLEDLLDAIREYYKRTKRRVTFEYILFDGVNDRPEDSRRLIRLSRTLPCKVNVIPFHPVEGAGLSPHAPTLRPAPRERAEEFVRRLREAHVTVFVRSSAGVDIDAACGQLAVRHPEPSSQAKEHA